MKILILLIIAAAVCYVAFRAIVGAVNQWLDGMAGIVRDKNPKGE